MYLKQKLPSYNWKCKCLYLNMDIFGQQYTYIQYKQSILNPTNDQK